MPEDRVLTGRAGWVVRIVVTVHLLAVFAQSVLAGRFLSGDYDSLQLHLINGMVILGLAVAQFVAGAVLRRAGGPVWPQRAAIRVLVVEALQFSFGYERITALHVPLGVMLIVWLTMLTGRAWQRPDPGRPPGRSSRRPGRALVRRRGGETPEDATENR